MDNLSIYLSIYLSTYKSINQSFYLSIYQSIYLSIYLSINLSINQSIYQSIYLSIYQSIYQSINQPIYLIMISIDKPTAYIMKYKTGNLMIFLHEICGAWVQADDVGSTFTLVEPATCGLLYDPSNPSQIPYWQSLGKRPSISIKSGYLAGLHCTSNNGPARWWTSWMSQPRQKTSFCCRIAARSSIREATDELIYMPMRSGLAWHGSQVRTHLVKEAVSTCIHIIHGLPDLASFVWACLSCHGASFGPEPKRWNVEPSFPRLSRGNEARQPGNFDLA